MREGEMECRAIRPLLPGYAEDDLRQPERVRCDAHLAACPGCRVVLDDLRRLPSALAIWQPPAVDLPRGAQAAARILERARPAPSLFVWRWGAAAAAALALVVAWWGIHGRVGQRVMDKPGAVVAQ